jgi:hypothetical protein
MKKELPEVNFLTDLIMRAGQSWYNYISKALLEAPPKKNLQSFCPEELENRVHCNYACWYGNVSKRKEQVARMGNHRIYL